MQSLLRWGVALSILGGVVTGIPFGAIPRAIALSEEQVVAKLNEIPVFTLADTEGNPLTAVVKQSREGEATDEVIFVFINPDTAQEFLDKNKATDSILAEAEIFPINLGAVYLHQKENHQNPDSPTFQFFPEPEQVDAAKAILTQNGEDADKLGGVPVFFGRATATNQEEGLMIIQRNQGPIVPFFLDKQQLQDIIDEGGKVQTDVSIEIGVLELGAFVNRLLTVDDPQLEQVFLIPTPESIEHVRQLRPPGSLPQPDTAPPPENLPVQPVPAEVKPPEEK